MDTKCRQRRSWEIDTEWEFLVASLLMKNQVESSRVPKAA